MVQGAVIVLVILLAVFLWASAGRNCWYAIAAFALSYGGIGKKLGRFNNQYEIMTRCVLGAC